MGSHAVCLLSSSTLHPLKTVWVTDDPSSLYTRTNSLLHRSASMYDFNNNNNNCVIDTSYLLLHAAVFAVIAVSVATVVVAVAVVVN